MTQEELAEKLDISVRYVQKLEGSQCPNVKIDTIAVIAKALNVKPAAFLEE
jgi:transcriptional regulator with XRE-family HTH domain